MLDARLDVRSVIHVVFDGESGSEARLSLYRDGVEQTADTADPIPLQPVTLIPDTQFVIGNSLDGMSSFAGTMYYTALYTTAFYEARVLRHAAALALSDDSP